jgi:hypothetical protein
MTKRKFFSIKYQKFILPDNRNFWTIARDEAVYRLDENLSRLPREAVAMRDKKMNCPCLGHMEEREKLEKFLKHFKIEK